MLSFLKNSLVHCRVLDSNYYYSALFHCYSISLPSSIVSAKKSIISFSVALASIVSFSPHCSKEFHLIFSFNNFIIMWLGVCSKVHLALGWCAWIWGIFVIFHQFQIIHSHYLLKYCFWPILVLFSDTLISRVHNILLSVLSSLSIQPASFSLHML